MNSLIHDNWSSFTNGLVIFTMIDLFNFTQNLVKHIVNLNAYWCTDIISLYSFKKVHEIYKQCIIQSTKIFFNTYYKIF